MLDGQVGRVSTDTFIAQASSRIIKVLI